MAVIPPAFEHLAWLGFTGSLSGETPDASTVVPPASRLSSLETLLLDFSECWGRGEHAPADLFIDRLDHATPAEIVELIYHEFCLAESAGLNPDPSSYLARFPAYRNQLTQMFGLHVALASEPLPTRVDLESLLVGDSVGPYRLLRELGRGTFARVFLAEQGDLDDRLVVLKITHHVTTEPQLLARCRHPHIVEVLRHGSTADGLHYVSMPFLGGATLAALIAHRRDKLSSRAGRHLLKDLDAVAAREYQHGGSHERSLALVARLGEARGLAWLIARLAEALDHAHRRGVTHGDLKPSNILITAAIQPLLLDFNLSIDWSAVDEGSHPGRGGTLAYMAPERLHALLERAPARGGETEARPAPTAQDRHRADLYALGLILAESLGGALPELATVEGRPWPEQAKILADSREQPRTTRRIAKAVPGGLRPILERCLAVDPADRYARAADLAEDLDRYVVDLPPRHVAAPASPWRWLRRRQVAVAVAGLVLTTAILAAGLVNAIQEQHRTDLAVGRLKALWGGHEPGVYQLRRPGTWQAPPPERIAADALQNLRRYGALESQEWRKRDDVRTLPIDLRQDLEAWLMGQALVLARARLDTPDPDPSEFRLALDAIESVAGPTPPESLRALAKALQGSSDAAAPVAFASKSASSLWIESYLQGVDLEPEQPRAAWNAYQSASKQRPKFFWAHYRSAVVAARIGEFRKAALDLEWCLDIFPDNPVLRLQFAGMLHQLRLAGLAVDQVNRGVQLQPESPLAHRSLALIQAELAQFDSAAHAQRRFHRLAANHGDYPSWIFKYEAEGLQNHSGEGRQSQNSTAISSAVLRALELREEDRPSDHDAQTAHATMLAAQAAQGGAASPQIESVLHQFEDVLQVDPNHLPAQLGRAVLLRVTRRPEAPGAFERLLNHPRFEELAANYDDALRVYHQVAFDLIQHKQDERARKVAQQGLDHAVRLRRVLGESHYALARTIMSTLTFPEDINIAAHHLRIAAERVPRDVEKWFDGDAAFNGLRHALRPALNSRSHESQ